MKQDSGCGIQDSVSLHLGDCLDIMPTFPSASIDMILCDLPYGTTACKWDTVIPFEPLWSEYKRLIKSNGAIVLFASQPFTTYLISSNLVDFKYCWIWDKKISGNPFIAKYQPLKIHEDICVFYGSSNSYKPQMISGKMRPKGGGKSKLFDVECSKVINDQYYPKSIIEFSNAQRGVHPTQKPVALCEYLIRTYTNEGETVMDNTMGSGTTGIACLNTNRRFIGIEREQNYFDIACQRINEARAQQRMFA